jgi:hypothetical protein
MLRHLRYVPFRSIIVDTLLVPVADDNSQPRACLSKTSNLGLAR